MSDILQLSESLRFPDQLADLRDAYMAMVETNVYYHQAGSPALALLFWRAAMTCKWKIIVLEMRRVAGEARHG